MNPPPLPYDQSELAAVSGIYTLLARLWSREVDASLYELIATPATRAMFVAVGGKLPATDLAADDSIAETLEQLAIEYCVLFVGPKNHLPPFQSVWQTGQFQSQAISSMHDFMDVVNFTTMEDSATSMPDHLAVQLSVMAHLCTLMKTDQRPELIEIAQQFFARHLTWQVDLVDEVIQRDNSEFYGSVAEMTREFLSQEQSIWLVAD